MFKALATLIVLGIAAPVVAVPARKGFTFIQSIDVMMVSLAAQSLEASRAIRHVYAPQLDLLTLDAYDDLEGALETGSLAPLPADPERFNIRVRRGGANPIAEMDLDHQDSYVSARPATIGLLLDVASRVTTGPIEITSMVRHGEYQEALAGTNVNANTAVPMHAMGLAFDIALVNTPLDRIREIRDVLVAMRDAGDLLFIGERRQLVFHVVPHPARIAHYTDFYNRQVGVPSSVRGVHVIATAPAPAVRHGGGAPIVTTEVVAVLPTDEHADEWYLATEAVDEPAPPPAVADLPVAQSAGAHGGAVFSAWLMTILSVVAILVLSRQQRHELRRERGTQIFDPSDAGGVRVEP